MTTENSLLVMTARLITATLIVVVMVIGKSFLIPLAWAVLIGMASYKLLHTLEQRTRLTRSLINTVFLLGILVFLILIGYFFYVELSYIFNDLPGLADTISIRLHDIALSVKQYGIVIPDHVDQSYISDWVNGHSDLIIEFISGIGLNIWNIILIMFYLFFLLYYRDLVIHFYLKKFKSKERIDLAKDRFEKSLVLVRGYIYGIAMITLISAAMNYVVLLIFGLKFALFWGVSLAVLNLIPFIGNIIGMLLILLFAFITKDNAMVPVLIIVSLFIMNFLQDNVVRPLIVGDKLKLNAFAVFIAIIIGGMIWGVSGMILFIPIVGIAKIILESGEENGVYAILFSELPKSPKKSKKIKDGKGNILSDEPIVKAP
jgi:predicted PurR-regulated permease PerM